MPGAPSIGHETPNPLDGEAQIQQLEWTRTKLIHGETTWILKALRRIQSAELKRAGRGRESALTGAGNGATYA